jgi:SAM-dependent methyltransferase
VRVAAAGLRNVTILQAHARGTGLPTSCGDALILRRVYHHLTDPGATNVDLSRVLRPGGFLAIIDFPPTFSSSWPWPPNDLPGIGPATAWPPASWSRRSPLVASRL